MVDADDDVTAVAGGGDDNVVWYDAVEVVLVNLRERRRGAPRFVTLT